MLYFWNIATECDNKFHHNFKTKRSLEDKILALLSETTLKRSQFFIKPTIFLNEVKLCNFFQFLN